VEDETDTGSTGQLVEREVVGVSVDHGTEFRTELGDRGEDHASLGPAKTEKVEVCGKPNMMGSALSCFDDSLG
jgi:hypothetical protein